MARILLVGGGCRGRALAARLASEGHTLRITTRSEERRSAIAGLGAECWVGTPERLATLRGALEGVTIVCWLLGSASGAEPELLELHTRRLEFFITQLIDTTVRGFVYEARGTSTPPAALAAGEEIARALTAKNAIPLALLNDDPAEGEGWVEGAAGAIARLLDRR